MSKKSVKQAIAIIQEIPTDQIDLGSVNVRTRDRDITSLVASIREMGQTDPAQVREREGGRYELIDGRNRYRAACALGIPLRAVVVHADDESAIERSIIANIERENLNPLEEARGFATLMEQYGRSIIEVCGRMGITPQRVAQRLALLQLAPALQAYVDDGRMTPEVALLYAQQPREAQERAALELGHLSTVRHADVQRNITTHALISAPFHTGDESLVPGVGACGTCPKQTGRQGALFDVLGESDRCLDTDCWMKKSRAAFEVHARDATKRGLVVIQDTQDARIRLDVSGKYIAASDTVYAGGSRYPRADELGIEPSAIMMNDTGRCVTLYDRDAAQAAAKALVKKEKQAAKTAAAPPARVASVADDGTRDAHDVQPDAAAATAYEAARAESRAKQLETQAKQKDINVRVRLLACAHVARGVMSGQIEQVEVLRGVARDLLLQDHADSTARAVCMRRFERERAAGAIAADMSPKDAVRYTREAVDVCTDPLILLALIAELRVGWVIAVDGHTDYRHLPADDDGELRLLGHMNLDLARLARIAEQELKDEARAAKRAKGAKTDAAEVQS